MELEDVRVWSAGTRGNTTVPKPSPGTSFDITFRDLINLIQPGPASKAVTRTACRIVRAAVAVQHWKNIDKKGAHRHTKIAEAALSGFPESFTRGTEEFLQNNIGNWNRRNLDLPHILSALFYKLDPLEDKAVPMTREEKYEYIMKKTYKKSGKVYHSQTTQGSEGYSAGPSSSTMSSLGNRHSPQARTRRVAVFKSFRGYM
ncbi:hypothetical protein T439DRAFT_356517 [Meredithblackwellia eburnea MCA 4105]